MSQYPSEFPSNWVMAYRCWTTQLKFMTRHEIHKDIYSFKRNTLNLLDLFKNKCFKCNLIDWAFLQKMGAAMGTYSLVTLCFNLHDLAWNTNKRWVSLSYYTVQVWPSSHHTWKVFFKVRKALQLASFVWQCLFICYLNSPKQYTCLSWNQWR